MGQVDGFEIAFHTALAEPVTLGGAPREIAVLIGTLTAMLALGLQVPLIGLPLGLGLWTGAYVLARRDPYVFDVLRRHIRQPATLDG
ncbi:VirB3 family type IV secretion system protein [Caulobacter sp.]|uniref:VirB3 family type IV secretion system protein n=1 Tax=Caulobacter sp. TaxID=78 RepID=UPI001B1001EE|nr:VirB3 family type IV secretion system protein [Caulobacter sp.]MBO9547139.1 VirB3 family type IV secretion system protein [Caulobacter sp.]